MGVLMLHCNKMAKVLVFKELRAFLIFIPKAFKILTK